MAAVYMLYFAMLTFNTEIIKYKIILWLLFIHFIILTF